VVLPTGPGGRVVPAGTRCTPFTCGVTRRGPNVWLQIVLDLIPASCWFTNVRSCVSARDWDWLRTLVYGRAGNRCEACGAGVNRAHQVWLEAHERWDYHHTSRAQRLTRLVCLCTRCHQATHFGYAEITGRAEQALAHLCAVNHWTRADAEAHIAAAASLWRFRSETDWSLDLSFLTGVGITPQPPTTPAHRRTQAATDLAVPAARLPGRSIRICPQQTARPRGPRSARGNARAKPRHGGSPPNKLG